MGGTAKDGEPGSNGQSPAVATTKRKAARARTRQDAASGDDGRRRRSRTSRARIIDAMLALVRQGNHAPSAAEVARAAGVGLRTVFRHFADMDSLYREMSALIRAEVLPSALRPFATADWRSRLDENIDRRVGLFEAIFPFRISADLRRHSSRFLMEDYRRNLALERSTMRATLPPEIVGDSALVEALTLAVSFDAWRSLRDGQELSVADAREVVRRTVAALLAGRDAATDDRR